MPHNQCPPSRRGHAWRELTLADLPCGPVTTLKAALVLRRCKRCSTFGRVSNQGVVHVVEAP